MTRWKALLTILAVAFAGTVQAQNITPQTRGTISCVATAAPVTVRGEGITELLGDILLHCTNLAPAAGGQFDQYVTTNISVSLAGVNVTNNIDFGEGAQILDAVLVVNGNESTTPRPTSVQSGSDPRFQQPQYGYLAASNRVEWHAFQFPVPGAPNDNIAPPAQCAHFDAGPGGCFPTTTTLRITSLRGNPSQLGVPGPTPTTQVTAFVSITGEVLPPITNNVLNVAVPLLGMNSSVLQPAFGTPCEATEETVSIRLQEGFATAFKTEGSANVGPGNTADEAGYYAPGSNGGDGASGSTRIIHRFLNIPTGVRIKAPKHIDLGSPGQSKDALEIRLVTGTDASGAGGTVTTDDGYHMVDLSQPYGFVVYEIRDSNPNTSESIDVPFKVSWDDSDNPPLGSGEVSTVLGPLSSVLTASKDAVEPRFIDTNLSETLLMVGACEPPPPPPPPAPGPNTLTKISGDNQSVASGSPFPVPLVARLSQGGQPVVSGVVTAMVLPPGSQYVSCTTHVATGNDGLASISCVAGSNTTGSSQKVMVQLSDGTTQLSDPFRLTVQSLLMSLRLLSPATIRLPVNQTTPDAIRVKVETGTQSAAGIPVYFFPPTGIQINPAMRTTDSRGLVSAPVQVACISEPSHVHIGLSAATSEQSVRVEPLAAGFESLSAIQGSGQSARPGERLAQALLIAGSDECGNPISGLDVNWDVEPQGAATLEASHFETNHNGRASTLVRVASYVGSFSVMATVEGRTVQFQLEAEPGPSGLVSESGLSQRVPKGHPASLPLVTRVTDPGGNGLSGVRVNFRVVQGSGQLDPSSVLTGGDGRAAAVFTAGLQLGPVVIEASAFDETATFDLFVTGRKPIVDRSAVVDGAGFGFGLTGGGAGSIFGVNMMEDINGVMVPAPSALALSADGKAQGAGLWPLEFEGVSIRVNGIPAPLFALANIDGSEQINFQVPFDVASASVATIEINNNGNSTTVNNVPILPAKPRMFEIVLDGKFYAAALHLDYTLVEPNAPARPGQIISLFLTGLGPTDPPVPTNLPGPIPPAVTIAEPVVTIDGVEQEVLGSFYAPQLTSVYQVNMRIKEGTAPGEREIEVLVDGLGGQVLALPIGAQ